MSGVWTLAQQEHGRPMRVAFELITRGRALADKLRQRLTAVVLGQGLHDEHLLELLAAGADAVLAIEAAQLEHMPIEPAARCLLWAIRQRGPHIMLAPASCLGRTLMPYLAALAHTGLTADCTDLDIEPSSGLLLQTRPAIGGNVMATIKTPDHRPQLATVRPHSTVPAEPVPGRTARPERIERLAPPAELLVSRTRRLAFTPNADAHALADAQAVVTVGRGIKTPANLPLAQALANALGAALGATRDAVDRGWLPYEHQVGLSGKTVSPRLYVALGVSGSIQHLAGMSTSHTVVAVNTDPQAQIFRVADLGIVGDLRQVVPHLTRSLLAGDA